MLHSQAAHIAALQAGVAALVIANKYEEVYGPTLRDFEQVTAGTYSRSDILKMERIILRTLDFNLTVPTTMTFLSRYIKASNYGQFPEFRNLAQYLCEWSLLSNTCLSWAPSQIAAAAIHACFKAFSLKRAHLRLLPACFTLHPCLQSQCCHHVLQSLPCSCRRALFVPFFALLWHPAKISGLHHTALCALLQYRTSDGAECVPLTAVENNDWPRAMRKHTGYCLDEIETCAAYLVNLMDKASGSQYHSLHHKFKKDSFSKVARYKAPMAAFEHTNNRK